MTRQIRCQSLPPVSKKSSLQVTSCLATKRQFFSHLAEAKNEVATLKSSQPPQQTHLKKFPLVKAKSQDSSVFSKSKFFSNDYCLGSEKEKFSRASSETRDLIVGKDGLEIIGSKKSGKLEYPLISLEEQECLQTGLQEKIGPRKEVMSPKELQQTEEMMPTKSFGHVNTSLHTEETDLLQDSLQLEHEVGSNCNAAVCTQDVENFATCDLAGNELKALRSEAIVHSTFDDMSSLLNKREENFNWRRIKSIEKGSNSFESNMSEDVETCSLWSDSGTCETLSELCCKTDSELHGRAHLLASLEEDYDSDEENFIAHPHSTPNSPALSRGTSLDMSKSIPNSPLIFLRRKQEEWAQTVENPIKDNYTPSTSCQLDSLSNKSTLKFRSESTTKRLSGFVPKQGSNVQLWQTQSQSGLEEIYEAHPIGTAFFRSNRLHTVPGRSLHDKKLLKKKNVNPFQ